MDLANTEMTIRERTASQRLDMALRLTIRLWKGVLGYAALGIVPFLLLNGALIYTLDPYGNWEASFWQVTWVLVWFLTLQFSPMVMAPLIVYLGNALFRQPKTCRAILGEVLQRIWTQFLIHGLFRLNAIWVAGAVVSYSSLSPEAFFAWVVFGSIFSFLLWGTRPYLDFIIYLERLPLSNSANKSATIGARSRSLHAFDAGRVSNDSLLALSFSFFLFYSVYAVALWLVYWLTFDTVTYQWFSWSVFAVSLWLVITLITVFRFLGYLDIRIRSEGWELELQVKREAASQFANANRFGHTRGAIADSPAAKTEGSHVGA